jgi:hypothetical protein
MPGKDDKKKGGGADAAKKDAPAKAPAAVFHFYCTLFLTFLSIPLVILHENVGTCDRQHLHRYVCKEFSNRSIN